MLRPVFLHHLQPKQEAFAFCVIARWKLFSGLHKMVCEVRIWTDMSGCDFTDRIVVILSSTTGKKVYRIRIDVNDTHLQSFDTISTWPHPSELML